METELRADHRPDRTILDEVVVEGCTAFHAEMMSGNSLRIGVSDATGALPHAWIESSRKGGAALLTKAEDRGAPTITRGAAFAVFPRPVRAEGEPEMRGRPALSGASFESSVRPRRGDAA